MLQFQNEFNLSAERYHNVLSKRQVEILLCIVHAMSDDEIATQLDISVRTALSHRQRIMRKLDIHNTPKLIRYCIERGFDSAPVPAHKHRLTAL